MDTQKQASFNSVVGIRYRNCRLSNFEPQNAKASETVGQLQKLCESFNDHFPFGIFLYGQIGTGKDHLIIACLRAAVVNYGKSAKWISGTDLYDQARLDIRDDNNSIIAECAKPDILVLSDPVPPDDKLSDFEVRVLHRLVDKRYRECRPTWVTINVVNAKQARERLTGPIWSRLIDNSLRICCDWPSYRDGRKVTV